MLLSLPRAGFTAASWRRGLPGRATRSRVWRFIQPSLHELYRLLPGLAPVRVAELTRDPARQCALDHRSSPRIRLKLVCRYALYDPRAPVSSHFDEVLRFARDKRLRPMSLEEIAAEMIDRARPTRELTALSAVPRRIDVAV